MSSSQAEILFPAVNREDDATPEKASDTILEYGPQLPKENDASLAGIVPAEEDGPGTGSDTGCSAPAEKDTIAYPSGATLAVVIVALALSVFLSALDIAIVATAIPKITDEFRGLDKTSWYGAAFFLTSGSFQASWGKAYKYFDLKHTFLASIALFELGSLLCGAAPNADTLIAGRAVAGMGCAGMATGGYVIIAFIVEPRRRPSYTGIIGCAYCFASVVGPLVGGAITSTTTWRWCFYINLPIGAVTVLIILFFFRTPAAAKPVPASWREKFLQADPVGVCLVMAALVCYSLAMQYGGQSRAWNSSEVIGLLVGFVLIAIVFAVWERYSGERATVPLRLLGQRHVYLGSAYAFLFAGSYYLVIYYLPIYFQSVGGASPLMSGVDILPLILAAAVGVVSSGIFITKTGHAVPLQVCSAVIACIGSGLLYTLGVATSLDRRLGYQIIGALGWGAGFQIPAIICQALAQPEDIPSVTAVVLFFLNIGSGILLSAAESAFANTLVASLPAMAPGVDPATVLHTGATELRSVFPADQMRGILEAYMAGIKVAFALAIAASGLALAIAMLMGVLGHWRRLEPSAAKNAAIPG
ncbi:major facilitator superfamily domain-containing protein [Achaetomium macrosporum]|uniref:Major facilitator superfamily domain-containing protein n=1 Tax=Achaetomium macrosporum TaxID=79813 RepID=A0AAN7CGB2_9PEZI|nr:major facilitator superfamily domain-containing protein [Achaetomium macrosporum]